MTRYAVKIGEVLLRSAFPITQEDRGKAMEQLRRKHPGAFFVTAEGVEVELNIRP